MQRRKIIIDTDPGQDDAVAILLALASPEEIEVLGITAVAGNVPLDLTQKNERIVCELAQKTEIKVFAGFAGALGLGAIAPIFAITAVYGLEMLVVVIQAYVFTILTCVYLNDALHPGH